MDNQRRKRTIFWGTLIWIAMIAGLTYVEFNDTTMKDIFDPWVIATNLVFVFGHPTAMRILGLIPCRVCDKIAEHVSDKAGWSFLVLLHVGLAYVMNIYLGFPLWSFWVLAAEVAYIAVRDLRHPESA